MRATRRNLQAQPKILKKLPENQIYQSKRKFSPKNYVSYLKSVKEPKFRMGATRRNMLWEPEKSIGLKLSSENLKLKGKKAIRITKFASRRPAGRRKIFFRQNSLFYHKSSNSSRTSISFFGLAVPEINSFITIVNRM
jgi:hypothetical protein